jgi:hypothetical protein
MRRSSPWSEKARAKEQLCRCYSYVHTHMRELLYRDILFETRSTSPAAFVSDAAPMSLSSSAIRLLNSFSPATMPLIVHSSSSSRVHYIPRCRSCVTHKSTYLASNWTCIHQHEQRLHQAWRHTTAMSVDQLCGRYCKGSLRCVRGLYMTRCPHSLHRTGSLRERTEETPQSGDVSTCR